MSPLTRRDLARLAAAASGAALLPAAAAHAGTPADAALAATPAALDAAERMEVRKGVAALARSVSEARRPEVPNDVDPAFSYIPRVGWK